MQAQCAEPVLVAASEPAETQQHEIGHSLYQAAIVVAILLFLISFWSC